MSLSAWEQRALDSIKDGLASSDPTLAARLTMFTRLVSGEEMSAREKIQAGSRRAVRRSHLMQRHTRQAERPGVPQAMLLWLVITVALIAVALAFSRGGSQGKCTGTWATLCTDTASAPNPVSGIP